MLLCRTAVRAGKANLGRPISFINFVEMWFE